MAILVRETVLGQPGFSTRFRPDFFERRFDSRIRYCHGCRNACDLAQPVEQRHGEIIVLETLGGRCDGCRRPDNVREYPQGVRMPSVPVVRERRSGPAFDVVNPSGGQVRSSAGRYFAGCTFGWYTIAQSRYLPQDFRDRLASGGHTMETVTMGLNGFLDFLRDLSEIGNRARLKPILEYLEACQRGLDRAGWLARLRLRARLLATIRRLSAPLWAKLKAAEDLRARSLVLRAHELEPGSVSTAYRQALELLRRAHTRRDIAAAHRQGVALLEAVARDDRIRPRVVAVGELYVVLTSFANRGTIEHLLAREGIEVVEGVSLGGFLNNSLREMPRRARRGKPWVRPAVEWLRRRNVYVLEPGVRNPEARPFLIHEVGGDGLPTVGHARYHVEHGCDRIVQVYPFKCMPEGIAKDAVKELADLYGVRYLGLSFDRETDIERLRTEISTFAALLRTELARAGASDPAAYGARKRREVARRQAIGRILNRLYGVYRRPRHSG